MRLYSFPLPGDWKTSFRMTLPKLTQNIALDRVILPFQGVQWNNRQLTQGVAVGLGYIAPSVRS